MKSTVFALGLVAAAVASPLGLHEKRAKPLCIKPAHAQKFMDRFINVLQHTNSDLGDYVTTAQAILTDDFQEISDSINMLADKPLGDVTADKTAYIASAQKAPAASGIETLGITVSSCDSFIWEWNFSAVGKATYPVKGIALFKVIRTRKGGKMVQASQLKLEFNNIAWGLDTGYGWVKQDGTLLGRAPSPPPAPATVPARDETPIEEVTSEEAPVIETTTIPETVQPEEQTNNTPVATTGE